MGEASGKVQTTPCPSQSALVGARRRCVVSAARGEVIVVALRRRRSLTAQRLGLAFVQQAIALPPRVMHVCTKQFHAIFLSKKNHALFLRFSLSTKEQPWIIFKNLTLVAIDRFLHTNLL